MLAVGLADNLLRPLLVGKDTKMPDLIVMLTTLGGLTLFGAAGIVLGPLVGALSVTAFELLSGAIDETRSSDVATEV